MSSYPNIKPIIGTGNLSTDDSVGLGFRKYNSSIGEIIVTGSTSGNTLTLVKYSGGTIEIPFNVTSNIIRGLTFDQIYANYTANTLNAGHWYEFEFQTIHKIPYTNVIHYGDFETLQIYAVSSNSFHFEAMSVDFPMDKLYYNIDDIHLYEIVETINPVSPVLSGTTGNVTPPIFSLNNNILSGSTLSRPGRIYYREDTINRLSASYDWRNVVYRRYNLTGPAHIVNPSDIMETTSQIKTAEVYNSTGGTSYLSLIDSYGSINTTNGFIVDLSSNIGNLYSYQQFSATPDYFRYYGYNIAQYGGIPPYNNYYLLQVDNSNYVEYKTFFTGQCFNIQITDHIASFSESISYEYYPNIVFKGRCNNVTIGNYCSNITVVETGNITIGDFNSDITIFSNNTTETVIKIGDNNRNILINNRPYSTRNDIKIGNNNENIVLIGGSGTQIGDNNYNQYLSTYIGISANMFDTNLVPIGAARPAAAFKSLNANNNDNIIGSFNNKGIIYGSNNIIGNLNTSYSIMSSTYFNNIGNNNSFIFISDGSSYNTIKNNCRVILCVMDTKYALEGILIGGIKHNIVGDNCEFIYLVGNYNEYLGNNKFIDSYGYNPIPARGGDGLWESRQMMEYPEPNFKVQYEKCSFTNGFSYLSFVASGTTGTPYNNVGMRNTSFDVVFANEMIRLIDFTSPSGNDISFRNFNIYDPNLDNIYAISYGYGSPGGTFSFSGDTSFSGVVSNYPIPNLQLKQLPIVTSGF